MEIINPHISEKEALRSMEEISAKLGKSGFGPHKSQTSDSLQSASTQVPGNNQDYEIYNKEVENLDPDYTLVQPYRTVLVRCFCLLDEVTENNLIIPKSSFKKAKAEKHSQFANQYEHLTKYPFSNKAIVVSSGNNDFKTGDIVLLNKRAIDTLIHLEDGYEKPVNQFTLTGDDMPTIPGKHFGYLMLDPYSHIVAFLNKPSNV